MRTNLLKTMRVLSFMAALVIAVPLMIRAQSGKQQFAGSWGLNEMKSSPSQTDFSKLVVREENNMIIATFSRKDGKSWVNKYSLDGKESVNHVGMDEIKSVARLSDDGKLLTITNRFVYGEEGQESHEVWSLTDPRTLSIEVTTHGGSGDVVTKRVYDKR